MEIVKLLISSGADVNATTRAEGYTPLDLAVCDERWDICKILIANPATNVNIASLKCSVPLHSAVLHGQLEICEMLLGRGANVNVVRWDGETPLSLAVLGKHEQIARLLITNGADVNYKLRTAIVMAREEGFDLVDVILEVGFVRGRARA